MERLNAFGPVTALSSGVAAPGPMSRLEAATGLLVRGIRVNGNYLIVDSCDIKLDQEIDLKYFVQGGPYGAISNIGKKSLSGQIICPVRVDRNGNLESGVVAILNNAQNPFTPLSIDTNHMLSHPDLTVDDPGTDNNALLTFDCVVVSELELAAKNQEQGGLTLTATIVGTIDGRNPSDVLDVPNSYRLGRQLGWADGDASRYQSAMSTVVSISVTVHNEIEQHTFLIPSDGTVQVRSDQPTLIGATQCKWGGTIEEMVRRGAGVETFIHGGAMVGENLVMDFGPFNATIPVPLFKPATQPLTPSLMKRTTKYWAQTSPGLTGQLFWFSENST